jgi:hypothetical protein
MSESWEDYISLEDLNFKKPESWDAKDFIYKKGLFCPICEGACREL